MSLFAVHIYIKLTVLLSVDNLYGEVVDVFVNLPTNTLDLTVFLNTSLKG